MIALFALFYAIVGISGAVAMGSVADALKAGRLSAPIAFLIIAVGSICEALLVLAVAAWVLR